MNIVIPLVDSRSLNTRQTRYINVKGCFSGLCNVCGQRKKKKKEANVNKRTLQVSLYQLFFFSAGVCFSTT